MTKWVADIGSNHNLSVSRCRKLIREAKSIGCWGAKFQLFKPNLYTNQYLDRRKELAKWELPQSFIPNIAKYCKEVGIKFGCTPFYLDAVDELAPYVDFLKIGSYELLWLELISKAAATGKPLIISTGMSTLEEVWAALKATGWRKITPGHIGLLHCNSTYPAKPEECQLYKMREYKIHFSQIVGWSDHTRSPGVIHKAIESGAEIIEFHLDLEDGKGWEYQVGHCWKPSEIGEVIKQVRLGEEAYSYKNLDLSDLRWQRTDPRDGMRPLREVR